MGMLIETDKNNLFEKCYGLIKEAQKEENRKQDKEIKNITAKGVVTGLIGKAFSIGGGFWGR
eukprot:CAMPEP_0116924208 /NCGR_PEP_ID=MMETSP0467-20121206/23358_1 /TAXON_ID=283647 /ORGANISM="Mesodinium pulex, Strain SPMC105" /LENGTH=61 /DNA_ID=CAMNT_0004602961 /DNA_START=464 /DNA_END=646 /DNA_ORIENTATION=+